MHREGAYSGTNRNLALGGHIDAEAVSVVREAGVAGDNTVAVDAAEAQRIGPVRASILERDGGSVGRAEEDNTGPQYPSTPRVHGQHPRW